MITWIPNTLRTFGLIGFAALLTACGSQASTTSTLPVKIEASPLTVQNPVQGPFIQHSLVGSGSIHAITHVDTLQSNTANAVPILTYHHILTQSEKNSNKLWKNNDMVVTVDQFEAEMKYLHDNHYNVITLSQLEAYIKGQQSLPKHSVAITFDDGYESNFHYASPILREYGFHATVFAIVGAIAKESQPWDSNKLLHFSTSEIKENADVFEVDSHTYAMHYVIKGGAAILRLPANVVLNDLKKARVTLNNCNFFCYPYGGYNARAIHLLQEAGYQLAVTTHQDYAKKGTPLFEVPRFTIYPTTPMSRFVSIVSGTANAPQHVIRPSTRLVMQKPVTQNE